MRLPVAIAVLALTGCASVDLAPVVGREPMDLRAETLACALEAAPGTVGFGASTIRSIRVDEAGLSLTIDVPAGEPRGVAVWIHGYMASSESTFGARERLAEAGFVVVSPDLPGHGGSAGIVADIDDFHEYGQSVAAVMLAATGAFEGPVVVVAHSLGAAAFLESRRVNEVPVAGVVLLAPLLRLRGQGVLRLGAALTGPFMKVLPGGIARGWFEAFVRWHRSLDGLPVLEAPVLLVASGRDSVIDARFAARLLGDKVRELETIIVAGLDHWEAERRPGSDALWIPVLRFLDQASGDRSLEFTLEGDEE